jgi:hypothetical protein
MSKDKKSKEAVSEEHLNEKSDATSQEHNVQELNLENRAHQDSDQHELSQQKMKLQETKKPTNLRANAVPLDGYVLSVDGKLKTRYDSSVDAVAAGKKLKQNFPVLQVSIYDASGRNYTPVE